MKYVAPLRRIVALPALAVSVTLAAFATISEVPDATLLLPKAALAEQLAMRLDDALLASPTIYVREERFEHGDTLAGLLGRLEIGEADSTRVLRQREMRRLRPDTHVTAQVRADGELVGLSFLTARDTLLRIERAGRGLIASEERAPLVTLTVMKSAVVRSSLFAAADASGIPDGIALQIADMFGGEIDFHRDLRMGDRFSVVYEVQALDGRPVRIGRVLAAEFVNNGKAHRAAWFATGYYTPSGQNLRKAFLRSPLEFSRVSSGFGMRMHPFLNAWRAHRGVDYAAPAGSRVRAVGDGVVEFAGRDRGYGNVVVLRHSGQYASLYAHLKGFARGVRKGARIAQGGTVGYVGQTGWATGPHLHYEFRVAGQARNPLRVALPAAQPVAAHEMPAFRAHATPLAKRLELLADSRIALFE